MIYQFTNLIAIGVYLCVCVLGRMPAFHMTVSLLVLHLSLSHTVARFGAIEKSN